MCFFVFCTKFCIAKIVKWFHEGLHKIFWENTKCENKNLSFKFLKSFKFNFFSLLPGLAREGLAQTLILQYTWFIFMSLIFCHAVFCLAFLRYCLISLLYIDKFTSNLFSIYLFIFSLVCFLKIANLPIHLHNLTIKLTAENT